MKALLTGATSGIGFEMIKELINLGYDVIAVGRNETKLLEIKDKYHQKVINTDLADLNNCYKLFEEVGSVDLLINCAGFGDNGYFTKTNLDKELLMIDTNIKALHILTKLYLNDMVRINRGKILNVGSIAGFMPGPLMASYYATKAYVVSLTRAVAYELKKQGSNVYLGVLCPGPVKTNFFTQANASFMDKKAADASYVAHYAIKKMNRNKVVIIPKLPIKFTRILSKIFSMGIIMHFVYKIQHKRKVKAN